MADTLPNLPITEGVWTDIYAAFPSIPVGTQITVQNLGSNTLYLNAKATEPNVDDGFKALPPFREAVNDSGDSGAWILSNVVDSVINVSVVV